jgi:hypothetical protein
MSGNPTGRPVGRKSSVVELRRILDIEVDGRTNARRLAQLTFDQAMTGDFRFIQFVIDKTESSILVDAISELKELVYAERDGDVAGSDGDEVGDPGAAGS